MPAQRKMNQSNRLTAAGLIAVTAATLLMMAWVIFPTPAFADQNISIENGSLSSHGCDDTEWHFIINGLTDQNNNGSNNDEAPATIHVTWANSASADVPVAHTPGGTAHYHSTANLDSTVTDATAVIYDGWDGVFTLSHGPCETPPEKGRIEIEKQTNPAGDPAIFTFTGEINTTLGDDDESSKVVEPGPYTVTETGLAGWTLTDITCTDPTNNSSGVVATGIATFNVASGETVHCTFTNTKNTTTTTPGGGGGGGGGGATTTTTSTTTTTTPTVAPTTIHKSTTTPDEEVLPTTVKPGGTAFTGVENVVPIGAIALTLLTSGSGLLWAGSRRRRQDGSEDQD